MVTAWVIAGGPPGAVAVTVTVVLVCVVPPPLGVVLPPPHAGIHNTATARMVIIPSQRQLRLRFPIGNTTSPKKPGRSIAYRKLLRPKGLSSLAEAGAVMVMVVVAAFVAVGVNGDGGEKLQVAPVGSEQVRVTA